MRTIGVVVSEQASGRWKAWSPDVDHAPVWHDYPEQAAEHFVSQLTFDLGEAFYASSIDYQARNGTWPWVLGVCLLAVIVIVFLAMLMVWAFTQPIP